MCVIINTTIDKITKDELIRAWWTNPNGASVWLQGWEEPRKFEKYFHFQNFIDDFQGLKTQPENAKKQIICHFRISTGGQGLHPFKIPRTTMYLYHNGICGKPQDGHPDTWVLAQALRGLSFSQIIDTLNVLNQMGKGKFTLLDINADKWQDVGFSIRSNKNHLPYTTPSFIYKSKKNEQKTHQFEGYPEWQF